MRIISGAQRGRIIVAPRRHSTRPTADRTRQALFNVLEHAAWAPPLRGARVADLFAGSGALGLEALSRGAATCQFVDVGAEPAQVIARNLEVLGLADRAQVVRQDARRAPAPASPFDLVFLDPPYGQDLEIAVLERLGEGWLRPGGVAVVERAADAPEMTIGAWERLDSRAWGAARVSFLTPRP
jgi:16S rRNA (guanine966-N2)-methyltransferase